MSPGEGRLGQVAAVHVAGADGYRVGRLVFLPRADAAHQVGERDERVVERGPMVDVLGAPYPLSPPPRLLAPRAPADGFAPGFEALGLSPASRKSLPPCQGDSAGLSP